jgi:probable rRNA maturation factor
VTVRITGPARRRGLPAVDRRLLRSRAARLLRELSVDGGAVPRGSELSILLADDQAIGALNASFRGRRGPTDVLSFSLLEGEHVSYRGALLGDVVIGIEAAARQARARRRSLDDEVARLLIHGALHLLGYDHARSDQARRMRAEERRLWRLVKGP